jgi:hypothetical protein
VECLESLAARLGATVSYWDRWVARVAGLAASRADGAALVAEAEALADVTDVVVRAYATDVLSRLAGDEPANPAPRGWGHVAERLASVTCSAGGAPAGTA